MNGENIDGLKHSEVVALIRAGGEEVDLLVVDRETDELFYRLGVTPSTCHVKGRVVSSPTHTLISAGRLFHDVSVYFSSEVYEDSVTEGTSSTPSPTTDLPDTHTPTIHVTLTDSPITNTTPKPRANGSSASQSSKGSTTQSDISSSDMSIQVREEEE